MKRDILSEIIANKRFEIDFQKRSISLDQLQESIDLSLPTRSMRESLINSDSGIIAEFKRRSPSKGWINENAQPEDIIPGYEKAGASALSILTDEKFFGGTMRDIRTARPLTTLPIIRKDFIVDPYQVYQARIIGADAILLIAAALDVNQCNELAIQAHELGLEVLLEIHSEHELIYINDNIDMVGINNRNLGTFHTDVASSFRLAALLPTNKTLISESGISDPDTVRKLQMAGFKGFFMGETFMKTHDPAKALKDFIKAISTKTTTIMINNKIIKICGMREGNNIVQAETLPIDMMGFIFYPKSPRYVYEMPDNMPKKTYRIGVFVNEDKETIKMFADRFGLHYIQLHGNESPDYCRSLQNEGFQLIKAFSVKSNRDLVLTEEYAPYCKMFLFDTKCEQYGGSGNQFDWNILNDYH